MPSNIQRHATTADDRERCYRAVHITLETKGIQIWIDGGWGVDALLGGQTRPHEDLDIVVQSKYVNELCRLLEAQGYRGVPRADTCPWNFVLGDDRGHQVDFHVIDVDANRDGVYGETGWAYRSESLTGSGKIGDHPVKCIAPEYVVKFRTGFKLRDRDYHDVAVLCDRFGVEYPPEFVHLKEEASACFGEGEKPAEARGNGPPPRYRGGT